MSSYLSAVIQSFYNPEIYRKAIVKWQGFGGKYMALVGLILAIILSISLYIAMNNFGKNEFPHIAKQIPPIELTGGHLSVEGEEPVVIQSRDKKLKITIDTTKTENEMRQDKVQIGVGKTFIFFTDYQGNEKSFDLNNIKENYKFTSKDVIDGWNKNTPIIRMIAIPFLWLGQFIDLVIEVVVIAVLSYIITAFMQEEYDFLTRMRLSVLAVTPAEILTTTLKVTIGHLAQPWLVLLLACLYIYVMIVLMRRLPPVTPTAEQTL